jgi:hypothetical protein
MCIVKRSPLLVWVAKPQSRPSAIWRSFKMFESVKVRK